MRVSGIKCCLCILPSHECDDDISKRLEVFLPKHYAKVCRPALLEMSQETACQCASGFDRPQYAGVCALRMGHAGVSYRRSEMLYAVGLDLRVLARVLLHSDTIRRFQDRKTTVVDEPRATSYGYDKGHLDTVRSLSELVRR